MNNDNTHKRNLIPETDYSVPGTRAYYGKNGINPKELEGKYFSNGYVLRVINYYNPTNNILSIGQTNDPYKYHWSDNANEVIASITNKDGGWFEIDPKEILKSELENNQLDINHFLYLRDEYLRKERYQGRMLDNLASELVWGNDEGKWNNGKGYDNYAEHSTRAYYNGQYTDINPKQLVGKYFCNGQILRQITFYDKDSDRITVGTPGQHTYGLPYKSDYVIGKIKDESSGFFEISPKILTTDEISTGKMDIEHFVGIRDAYLLRQRYEGRLLETTTSEKLFNKDSLEVRQYKGLTLPDGYLPKAGIDERMATDEQLAKHLQGKYIANRYWVWKIGNYNPNDHSIEISMENGENAVNSKSNIKLLAFTINSELGPYMVDGKDLSSKEIANSKLDFSHYMQLVNDRDNYEVSYGFPDKYHQYALPPKEWFLDNNEQKQLKVAPDNNQNIEYENKKGRYITLKEAVSWMDLNKLDERPSVSMKDMTYSMQQDFKTIIDSYVHLSNEPKFVIKDELEKLAYKWREFPKVKKMIDTINDKIKIRDIYKAPSNIQGSILMPENAITKAYYNLAVSKFIENMKPMQQAKVRKVLDTPVSYDEGIATRGMNVLNRVKADNTFSYDTNGKGKIEYGFSSKRDGMDYWLSVSKTELDFAKFVGMKADKKYTLENAKRNSRMEQIRKKYGDDDFNTVGGVQRVIDFYQGHLDKGHTLDKQMLERLADYKEYQTLKIDKELGHSVQLKKAPKNSLDVLVTSASESLALYNMYSDIKDKYPNHLALLKCGTFYETYDTDAKKVHDILDLTVTKRHNSWYNMAGFPAHALEDYLSQLKAAGVNVVIKEAYNKNINEVLTRKDGQTVHIINNQNSITMSKKKTQQVKQEDASVVVKDNSQEKTVNDKVKQTSTKAASDKPEEKNEEQVQHRPPQMITVNGQKVSHGHAFQSNKNPEDWFYTAKIDGKELRPQHMSAEDVKAWQDRTLKVEDAMQHYYPTKLMQKAPKEEFKVYNKQEDGTLVPNLKLSDGRPLDKFSVFKEDREGKEDIGKWKMYAAVGNRKFTKVLTQGELNAFFDRVSTPVNMVEKNFGEQLNLASAYAKYQIPENAGVEKVNVRKNKEGEWFISAQGTFGKTEERPISKEDKYSLFHTKTATKEQIAAKVFKDGFTAKPEQKIAKSRALRV